MLLLYMNLFVLSCVLPCAYDYIYDYDTDCITSDGQQYKCCIDVWQSPDFSGTANQCYLPDDSEQDNHSDGNHFSTWLFGGFGGFRPYVVPSKSV